ncbi:hypothetical protein J7E88_35035 [Streptomyces sp. ISL-10]|uniref:hypothetical protein n=1 Tax=Streptomyces sp. ISL-10 TaxID=2819172 RepID=UPI001BEB6983|nr:hypothetical protein [Streptomyces sp. ISL-10]MBT2370347.1 hypothetical protein [Streptomyces sp. ISL-10]
MPALHLEDCAARDLVAEMAKPAVAESVTRALFRRLDLELPVKEQELAAMEDRVDVPASTVDAKRYDLSRWYQTTLGFMDEDVFSPRWLAAWWNRADEQRRRQLCNLFFDKIEVRSGPAPDLGALHDERITLLWRRLG